MKKLVLATLLLALLTPGAFASQRRRQHNRLFHHHMFHAHHHGAQHHRAHRQHSV